MVPAAVVTSTLAAPAAPAGVVAVIWVSLLKAKLAVAPPIFTAVAPVKLVPVMVTDAPPAVGPEGGLMAVTVGAEAGRPVRWMVAVASVKGLPLESQGPPSCRLFRQALLADA